MRKSIVPRTKGSKMIGQILLVFSFVFFILAGFNIPAPPRCNFLGFGLAFWVLSILLAGVFK